MELSPRAIERRLARERRGVLATLRPDGAAALVPVVFAPAAGALWSPVDGKPKRGGALARLANVVRDARVALLLDAWSEDWTRLWWLRAEGRARIVRDADERGPGEAALRAKYPQYAATPLHAGEPLLLRIDVERTASWAASPAALREAEGDEP